MSDRVLEAIGRTILGGRLFDDETTVVWHAGEPCVLPPDWYVAATDRLERAGQRRILRQSFQTNATLIDDGWIDHFRRPGIGVGVSLDGPAAIHDRFRRTRSGGGTHARTMAGIDRLNRAGIPFHVIAVVSAAGMEYPRDMARALVDTGARWIGLNVEEAEGENTTSTLHAPDSLDRYRRFLDAFLDEVDRAPEPPLVRERERFLASARMTGRPGPSRNQENTAGAIVSVGVGGAVSTFSPELLGTTSTRYGSFDFGEIGAMSDLSDMFLHKAFLKAQRDIEIGNAICRRTCAYFSVCGGGSPSNKLGEYGTFRVGRTQHCDHAIRALYETLLDRTLVS